ncbi:hypothetical protein AGABI2DRAFT_195358 [Agaricus bisporus var. bisporus H97]|nr:hypothetical protein AGABI2DRAFT_195358 [Agaricus bisporus var. bisporus H97]EKV43122.1 hypothetical protein AGABI2DRAFT_195358 [Agaricus bisporus var. bisporus H97]
MLERSPSVGVVQTPDQKLKSEVDTICKRRVKDEEKNLSWWLDQSDPYSLFRADDRSRMPGHEDVIQRVQSVIRKNFGASYSVTTFGSVRYGAASAKSDMDLMIFDPKRIGGFAPSKKRLPRIYHVKSLAGTLKHAGFASVEAVPASVPIVKFRDPKSGIRCDLNVNHQPGYWNSIMIGRYATLSPHLPRLMLAIKRWSRPIGLNNPSPSKRLAITFSSYAFALMTIGFLQHRGLLPNLQENLGEDIRDRYFWNLKPEFHCDMRFKWHVPFIPANREVSTPSLFNDWFHFWANFEPDKQMVDICQGGIVPREGGENRPLCVKDPFIRVRNVTMNISREVFERLQEECQDASAELRKRSAEGGYVIM